jgi:hypothetical protein
MVLNFALLSFPQLYSQFGLEEFPRFISMSHLGCDVAFCSVASLFAGDGW